MDRLDDVLRIHRHPTIPTYECIVTINGVPGLALIDGGATASFLTNEFAAATALPTTKLVHPRTATIVQGHTCPIRHTITTDIVIGGETVTQRHQFYLTDINGHDALLGMDWIEKARPTNDYARRTLNLRIPNPRHPEEGTEDPTPFALVSPYQLVSPSDDLIAFASLQEPPLRAYAALTAVSTALPPAYHDFLDVFDEVNADKLPPRRPHDHEIHLLEGQSIPYGPLYSLSHREQEELRSYLDKMLANGFIRPSKSPAAAPLLFVPKKDGRLRPCVDYRALNAITVKDRYPIPLISEHLDRLATAVIFTKLDLKGAYNLLRIAEGHEWKTAFRTRYGSYEYLVMPFGLCNAPSTFQRLMNHVLAGLLDVTVIVYLDDILIFSDSPAEHPRHVRAVLERLRQHNLYCAIDKCEFSVQSVEFLGYRVTPDGVLMDPDKVRTVTDWPEPKSIRQIQVFLGFANFYRRFIRHYSRVVAPLTDLLRGKPTGPITLPGEAKTAFARLKEAFVSAPILRHFEPTLSTVLETDASDSVVAAVLSQWWPNDGKLAPPVDNPNTRTHRLHPVAYWSRKMIPAERNYEIHDKELLAIVDSCAQWRHYLHGLQEPFRILTDHQALQFFQTKRKLNRRQARWHQDLAEFAYIITYRAGKEAVRPDALSRRSDLVLTETQQHDSANEQILLPPSLFARSIAVPHQPPVPPEWIPSLSSQADLPPDVTMVDNLPRHTSGAVYLPSSLRTQALQMMHDSPTAGHPGVRQTYDLAKRQFFWPTLRKDVETYVSQCAACRRAKYPRHKPYGFLLPLSPPERPWASITMDHITTLPPSVANGTTYDTILVVVDRLTKYAVFIPCVGTDTADELSYALHRYVFAYFGLPEQIISDRGTTFVSSVWESVLRRLKIQPSFSTAYHPQTDGQTERMNQSLETFLRFYCNYVQDDWAQWLPVAQLALNNRSSSTTGLPPVRSSLSFLPRVHPELGNPDLDQDQGTPAQRSLSGATSLKICQEGIRRASLAMSKSFDRRRSERSFQRGEWVLLRTKHLRSDRPNRKLSNPLVGPFKITAAIGKRAYRLQLPADWRIHPVVHVGMLEEYPTDARESTDAPQAHNLHDDKEDFEVEEVIDSRRRGGRLQYRIRWKGYATPTWIPAADAEGAKDATEEFHRKHPNKPKPSGSSA